MYIPTPRVFHSYIPSFTGFSKNPLSLSQRKIGSDFSSYTPGLGLIFHLFKHLFSKVFFVLIVLKSVCFSCYLRLPGSVFTIVGGFSTYSADCGLLLITPIPLLLIGLIYVGPYFLT